MWEVHNKFHDNMAQTLAEDSPFYAAVEKRAAEFKRGKDNT